MPKMKVDYTRCFWLAVMRTLGLDYVGFAWELKVKKRAVYKWLDGHAPREQRYLQIVELLTEQRATGVGFSGAYDLLAAATGQERIILRQWAKADHRRYEGERIVSIAIWHRLGYPVRSYRVVDFVYRTVEVKGQYGEPRNRWGGPVAGYLPANPFELWPWPVPQGEIPTEAERPSMKRFRQESAQSREVERRRVSGRRLP